MIKHKSEDYKLSAVKYFLENKDTQENTCKIKITKETRTII